jgi:hypothetical protein
MSLFTDGLPAWWAMVVAVAALGVGVWLGELHGRGVGRGQVREDRQAERAARLVRSWRVPAEVVAPARQRRTSTAAFLNPPEVHHEDPGMTLAEADEYWAGVAHEAWLAHTDLAIDLANDDPTVTAWTQAMAESMDAWLEAHVYSVPIPYLPGEDRE